MIEFEQGALDSVCTAMIHVEAAKELYTELQFKGELELNDETLVRAIEQAEDAIKELQGFINIAKGN